MNKEKIMLLIAFYFFSVCVATVASTIAFCSKDYIWCGVFVCMLVFNVPQLQTLWKEL